jgi:RecB family exonuclease
VRDVALLQLSPTKAAAWLDCPRKFYLTYMAKVRGGQPWAHFSYANAVHAVLREWFDLSKDQRSPDLVAEMVVRMWSHAGFRDEEQSRTWQQLAIDMIRAYLAGMDPDFEPMSTERTLAFKTESFIMQGRIDRLDRSGDSVEVVDYKTGKSIPTPDEVRGSQALAMYALMVQRTLGETCTKVSLHHVPSSTCTSWMHSEESLDRHERRVAGIATDIVRAQHTWESVDEDPEMRDELFPAKPGPLCGFCDFWQLCDVGQAYTERKRPWDGLADIGA